MAFRSDIPALYTPETPNSGDLVFLDQAEARHARALRLSQGSRVMLLNGTGWRFKGVIREMTRRGFAVEVLNTSFEERSRGGYIDLAVGALSDRNRFGFIVEKGVELGLRTLIPLATERSEGSIRVDRLDRIARAALKQSQSAWIPRILPLTEFDRLSDVVGWIDATVIFHEQENRERKRFGSIVNDLSAGGTLALVGPEGGFSESEVDRAVEQFGADIVSLGDSRLRTETAAIVALACIRELGHNV